MLIVSEHWRTAHPGAAVGILAMQEVANPEQHPALDRRKAELEEEIRSRSTDRAALASLRPMQAYDAYYKRYKKTYHVLLQLESVALRGQPIPRVAALVEAMFMAELKNLLLTAGHDLDTIRPPLRLDAASGEERYVLLNGQEQMAKPDDMLVADAEGILSTVIHGPDYRTRITPATRRVLFVVYAPPGIGEEAVHGHLLDIQGNILLIAPGATVKELAVYVAR